MTKRNYDFFVDKDFDNDRDVLTIYENDYDDLGEWWDANPIDVVREATRTGAAPNISDAYTINGQPGDLYKCSSQGLFVSFFYLDWTKHLQCRNIKC